MESKKDLYDWFRYWTNGISSNKQKPLNIIITQLDGSRYPYKSKSKRLIKKWAKQHTLNTIKYKYCKVDMSKVSDFGSCNNEILINLKDNEAIKMASKEAEDYTNGLCIKCPDKMYCHKKCQEYKYSCEVFDAGVEFEKKKHEWHDVKLKLPEENREYLVSYDENCKHSFYVLHYDAGNWYEEGYGGLSAKPYWWKEIE